RLEEKKDALKVFPLPLEEARGKVRKGDLAAFVALKPGFGETNGFYAGPSPTIEVGIDPRRKAEAGYLQGLLMQPTFADMQKQFSDPEQARKQLEKSLAGIDQARDIQPEAKKELKTFLADLDRALGKMDKKVLAGGPEGGQAARIKQVEVTRQDSGPL